MSSLRRKMAEHGFESNESYDYTVRCLKNTPGPAIRCLNVEGDRGRRKTAFANALAHALEPDHVVYHDFTQTEEPPPPVVIRGGEEDEGKEEPPVGEFDRVMSDVCALSEAERTVLILDQVHAADFKDHIRIYRFLTRHEWRYSDAVFSANRKNLFVFLVSEEPLYHSLQKNSFRVWVSDSASPATPYKPADFQLSDDARPLLTALHRLFEQLGAYPTYSEYGKIIHDIEHNVRTAEELKTTVYGWTELIDRNRLDDEDVHAQFRAVMPEIEAFIGVDENLELTARDVPQYDSTDSSGESA